MADRGKRLAALYRDFDPQKAYPLEEAVRIVKRNARAKFDETVEIAMNLGIDPRHADQMVRGTVVLPHRRQDQAILGIQIKPLLGGVAGNVGMLEADGEKPGLILGRLTQPVRRPGRNVMIKAIFVLFRENTPIDEGVRVWRLDEFLRGP